MDYSWLLENDDVDSLESESDSEDNQSELETRLYSIIHHNDLSQPLPPELSKHYSIDLTDDGEVEVRLKNSLEEIKSEESKKVGSISENSQFEDSIEQNTSNDEVVICDSICQTNSQKQITSVVSDTNTTKTPKNINRQFRYSNVKLDSNGEFQNSNEEQLNTPYINYFNVAPDFYSFKSHKRFSDVSIPKSYDCSDWRNDANSSFISINSTQMKRFNFRIIKQMVVAMKKLNPCVSNNRLQKFAKRLYNFNVNTNCDEVLGNSALKKFDTLVDLTTEDNDKTPPKDSNKKKNNDKKRNTNKINGSISLNIPPFAPYPQVIDLSYESEKNTPVKNVNLSSNISRRKRKKNNKKNLNTTNGSIALNISPFVPYQTPVTDVASDVEMDSPEPSIDKTSKKKKHSRKLARCGIPAKWSKEMIKYYTVPSKKKMEMDIEAIIENMKQTTIEEDWWLDPRDRAGFYTPERKGRRCINCRERGHTPQKCPKPRKIPTCTLCGEFYHSDYTCPNRICMKCGVFLGTQDYGGECNDCYYSTFQDEIPCTICGNITHRNTFCPDLWRSFHATTEGEKKIPKTLEENKRKSCCNCGRRGHFSHNCPFVMYTGQQTSVFTTNYSAEASQMGTTNMVIPQDFSDIMVSNDIDAFLQKLSDTTCASIKIDENIDRSHLVSICGTFEQCKKVQAEIQGYVSTRKRKRCEPLPIRKRQRVRY